MKIMNGGLNDSRGKAWHGLVIDFCTTTNDVWRQGTIVKRYGAPTCVYLPDGSYILGYDVTEFVIRRDLDVPQPQPNTQ